jgi:hypothetical protein
MYHRSRLQLALLLLSPLFVTVTRLTVTVRLPLLLLIVRFNCNVADVYMTQNVDLIFSFDKDVDVQNKQ